MENLTNAAQDCAGMDAYFWTALASGLAIGLVLGLFIGAGDGGWD
jgi:hypothetical protein